MPAHKEHTDWQRRALGERARERALARNYSRRGDREARYIERQMHEYQERHGPVSPAKRQLLIAYWSRNFHRRIAVSPPRATPPRPVCGRPARANGRLVQALDKALASPDVVLLAWLLSAAVVGAFIAGPLWVATSAVAAAAVAMAMVIAVRSVLDSTVPANEVGQRAIQWWVGRDLPEPEGFTDPSWARLEDDLCQHATMWRAQYLSGEITAEELDARLSNSLLEPQPGLTQNRAHQCDGAHIVALGDAEQRCYVCHLTPNDPGW